MNSQDIEICKRKILQHVPDDGSTIGNKMLMSLLAQEGISEEQYWSARDELLKAGILKTGRGMGGSVHLIKPIGTVPPVEVKKVPTLPKKPSTDELKRKQELKKLLLKLIPDDGGSVGNMYLLKQVKKQGFSEEDYWEIRNALIEEGRIAKGRGYGGSVSRVVEIKVSTAATVKKYRKEKDLYEPCREVITNYWVKDNNLDPHKTLVEITAYQGHKHGKWTRPDITVVTVRSYPFVPSKILEVISFEIKPANNTDVKGVFETASHARYAHKSYLAIYMPRYVKLSDTVQLRLQEECERFGLGLIFFGKPKDWATYDIIVEPKRQNPAPEDTNSFISQQISRKGQQEILTLL